MQGFELKFNVYAENQQEAEEAQSAIIGFISEHAQHGRAVTGKKIADALKNWEKNPIVKNSIIRYLS